MELLILIGQILVIITAVSTAFAYVTLFERRLLARFQHRVGPNRAGPWGLLQPIADAIKLFFKEDIIPDKADKWVYLAAPAIAVITALIMWAVIPLGCWNIAGDYRACFAGSGEPLHNILQIADVNIGVLYLMAITSIGVYGITLAGWASNSKYSMLGGIRSAAQLVSYELALGTATLGAVMMAGTLSTKEMVDAQAGLWLMVPQFLGFVVFLVSATAELVRTPFDLVEAEQELTCGYNTEYGSMKFALFFMAEYLKMVSFSAVAVTFYMGGWHFPGLEQLGAVATGAAGPLVGAAVVGIASVIAFSIKVVLCLFFLVWMRASWPRVRYDMLMNIGWKWLLPMALVNVVMTAVVTVLVDNRWIQAGVLLVMGVAILVGATRMGQAPRPKTSVRLSQPRPEGAK